MGITRFDRPSTYAYQSPFQEIDFRSMMALGLGKQHKQDVASAQRQQYQLEKASTPYGGGDVEAYKQWMIGIEEGLDKMRQENPDLTTMEAKNQWNDFVIKPNEDLVSVKSVFEENEKKIADNFSQDRRKMQEDS